MFSYLFPLFRAIDQALALLFPASVRIAVWGAASGALVIGLYGWLSDQEGIKRLKEKGREIRKKMFDADLPFSDFMKLSRRNLVVAFRLCGKITGPALISFFVIFVVVQWISTDYSYRLPDSGDGVSVEASLDTQKLAFEPPAAFSREANGNVAFYPRRMSRTAEIEIRHAGGIIYSGRPMEPVTPVIDKKSWWNWLFADETGYLRADAALKRVSFAFPRRTFVPLLPGWLSTWEMPFFLSMTIAALAVKLAFKVK